MGRVLLNGGPGRTESKAQDYNTGHKTKHNRTRKESSRDSTRHDRTVKARTQKHSKKELSMTRQDKTGQESSGQFKQTQCHRWAPGGLPMTEQDIAERNGHEGQLKICQNRSRDNGEDNKAGRIVQSKTEQTG